MSTDNKETQVTDETVETVNLPVEEVKEEVVELTAEERRDLTQELQAIGTLMGATWHKPIYVGKNTKNPELQRSVAVNILSEPMLFKLHKRAESIMIKLGWFGVK